MFDRLLDSVVFIEDKSSNNYSYSFLICGDFNSRISVDPDFVEDDSTAHVSVLPNGYVPDSYLQRFSEDFVHVNSNGLLLLKFSKQTGLRIMNGRMGDDYGVGKFTFVGSRGSSVVDYILSSQDLFHRFRSFVVQDPNIMSDHCIINFSLEFENVKYQNSESETCGSVDGKYKWNNEYIQSFQQQGTAEKLQNLNQNIIDSSCNEEIDTCISNFTNFIGDLSSPIFKRTSQGKKEQPNFSKKKDTPWFDDKCEEKRYSFFTLFK